MKSLKVLLITSLISLALISYADKQPQPKKIIKIAIAHVNQVPGLSEAVVLQVDPVSINIKCKCFYRFYVRHDHKVYLVYGSPGAWFRFFRIQPVQVSFEPGS